MVVHCLFTGEAAYPRFEVDHAANESQIMVPARAYLDDIVFPEDVLVLMVDSRDNLYWWDPDNLVEIRGRTDLLVLDREAALWTLGSDVRFEEQPSEAAVEALLESAVLGLVELKTPRQVNGNSKHVQTVFST